MIVIDANNLIVGRLATKVAKMALEGNEIRIVNAEKAVFTGTESVVLAKFVQLRQRTTALKGPFFPKTSERILKRCIRGMLDHKSNRGSIAYKKIRCYVGVPEEFKNAGFFAMENANKDKVIKAKTVSIQRVAQYIGGSR